MDEECCNELKRINDFLAFTTFDASTFVLLSPILSSACLLSSLLGLFYLPNLGNRGFWSALLHSWHITTHLPPN